MSMNFIILCFMFYDMFYQHYGCQISCWYKLSRTLNESSLSSSSYKLDHLKGFLHARKPKCESQVTVSNEWRKWFWQYLKLNQIGILKIVFFYIFFIVRNLFHSSFSIVTSLKSPKWHWHVMNMRKFFHLTRNDAIWG